MTGVWATGLYYRPPALLRAWIYDAMGDEARAATSYLEVLNELQGVLEETPDDPRVLGAIGASMSDLFLGST